MFVIEKNVPVPIAKVVYPFADMEIGDSFFISEKSPKDMVSPIAAYRRKNPNIKFITRSIDGGVRVWRVA